MRWEYKFVSLAATGWLGGKLDVQSIEKPSIDWDEMAGRRYPDLTLTNGTVKRGMFTYS